MQNGEITCLNGACGRGGNRNVFLNLTPFYYCCAGLTDELQLLA